MPLNSFIFKEGAHLSETLFTIIEQVTPGSWRTMRVRCACGNEVVLTYHQAYYGYRYSCGCARRPRVDAVDYANATVRNSRGNANHGRELTVLWRDQATQQWVYVCGCCAETFSVSRGMERGLLFSLRQIAGEMCPNWRPYVTVENIVHLTNRLIDLGYTIPGSFKEDIAITLVPYFQKKHVRWSRHGKLLGFYGLPDIPRLPKSWKTENVEAAARARAKAIKDFEAVPPDADGFGNIL